MGSLALPRNFLEQRETPQELKQKVTKMKIQRQPGDLINFINEAPESPTQFYMDFGSLGS
jgi:hypothetical protein